MKTALTRTVLVVLFTVPIIACAQQNIFNNKDSISKFNDSIANAFINSANPVVAPGVLTHNYFGQQDSLNKDSVFIMYQQAQIAYYLFKKNEFARAGRVFTWQLLTSKMIFLIVNLIVLAGIWFSGVQFYSSLRKGEKSDESKFEISGKGISISSSILGLLVLTLSIVFFYLYLVYVYPIKPI